MTTSQIRTFAEAESVLAESLPGYTERVQQQQLAAFVEQVIAEGGHGLAEAGCGTGKSLATMIPAILGGRKTVVATATKALMEQYANKDVPFLQEHLPVEFTYALVKGRSNYLCRAKALETDAYATPALPEVLAEIEADPAHDGDFDHFTTTLSDIEKRNLSSTSAECPGKRDCPFGDVCFAEAAKQRGREAQVVITNTAMLLTDLKVRELTDGLVAMLGNYELVLIDEAHETEDYATNALKDQIRQSAIKRTITECDNFAGIQGSNIDPDVSAALRAVDAAWDVFPAPKDGEIAPTSLRFFVENDGPFVDLIEALTALSQTIGGVSITRDQMKSEARRASLAKRCRAYADTIALAITADEELVVRWIEIEKNNRTGVSQKVFNSAPVHVGSYLREWLWDTTPSVLISATLSTGGDFSFISDRLGLPETTKALSVGTPFDYEKQALLFIPPSQAPSPKDRNGWLGYSATMTQELVSAAGGGALLLFTSRSAMTQAYENLAPGFEAKGFRCLMQGQRSNKILAEEFSTDTHSVLFALKSFMTGVDFQGDTCRLVVIDKLPFPVPTDPIIAARCDQIKRYGGNDFSQFTIPLMTLTLEQAYGRLIRTSQDRGVVAILDSRLSSTGYGQRIVKNLPGSPRTTVLADVQSFYQEG